jgi:aldehyde dehydrogenase (NAD+)
MERNGYSGIFSTLIGKGSVVGERILSDKNIPLVSFTGSTAMGRHVSSKVAERFGRTILELGGNNAIIIDESANLDLVIPAVVFGAVGTAGQRCTSTRRIIIHESIKDTFIDRLLKAYEQVNIGNPLDSDTLMGPLINENAVSDFLKAVKAVKTEGGKILFGGEELSQKGNYVTPAIAIAQNDWDIVQHETFAPILYIMSYKNLNEAIDMHNAVPQGLSSSMFTTKVASAEEFLSHRGSDCGIANINIGTSGAEIGGAFGGEKETGGGRESGSDSWKQYMRRQTNTLNWSKELPLAQGIEFNLD